MLKTCSICQKKCYGLIIKAASTHVFTERGISCTRTTSHCVESTLVKVRIYWNALGKNSNLVITRPGVAGLFYIHFHHSTINSVSQSSFSPPPSKNHNFQTVRASDLKLWDNVKHPLYVTCHMPRVTCHMSHFIFHMSCVTCHVSYVMCHVIFLSLFSSSFSWTKGRS